MILITVKSYELEDTKETNLALPHYPCTKSNKKKCFLILKIWLNMYTAIILTCIQKKITVFVMLWLEVRKPKYFLTLHGYLNLLHMHFSNCRCNLIMNTAKLDRGGV